jgi:hypothetical protein
MGTTGVQGFDPTIPTKMIVLVSAKQVVGQVTNLL